MDKSQRIREVMAHYDLNISQFSEAVNINQANVSSMLNGKRPIGEGVVNKICMSFDNVNKDWILTGKGEMLKRSKIESNISPVADGEYMMVEYADLRASAGRLGGADVLNLPETRKRLVPKEYAKGGFLVIRVDGDSMDDGTKRSLSDGDEVLVYEKTDNHIEDLPIRKTLFVITSRDGNVLKQIKEINKEEGYIVCHSFNPRYEDYKMNISDIYQIFIVCKIVQKQISLI